MMEIIAVISFAVLLILYIKKVFKKDHNDILRIYPAHSLRNLTPPGSDASKDMQLLERASEIAGLQGVCKIWSNGNYIYIVDKIGIKTFSVDDSGILTFIDSYTIHN